MTKPSAHGGFASKGDAGGIYNICLDALCVVSLAAVSLTAAFAFVLLSSLLPPDDEHPWVLSEGMLWRKKHAYA